MAEWGHAWPVGFCECPQTKNGCGCPQDHCLRDECMGTTTRRYLIHDEKGAVIADIVATGSIGMVVEGPYTLEKPG